MFQDMRSRTPVPMCKTGGHLDNASQIHSNRPTHDVRVRVTVFKVFHCLKVVSSEKKGGWRVLSIDSNWYRTEVLGIHFYPNLTAILYYTYFCFRLFKLNILVIKLCSG